MQVIERQNREMGWAIDLSLCQMTFAIHIHVHKRKDLKGKLLHTFEMKTSKTAFVNSYIVGMVDQDGKCKTASAHYCMKHVFYSENQKIE